MLTETPFARRVAPWLNRLAVVIPPLLTFVLCRIGAGRRQLWRDELYTWWAVHLSLQDLFTLLDRVDAVIAPYYLFMHGWIATFGAGVATLRLPCALAMAGSALLVTKLGEHLHSRKLGFFAGSLFAVVPAVSQYGQEARAYAFAMLACLGCTFALVRALEAPQQRTRWGAYAVLIAALGYTHLATLAVLAAHVLHVLIVSWRTQAKERRDTWLRFGSALALGLVTVLPVIWIGMKQKGQIAWIPPPSENTERFAANLFNSETAARLTIALAVVGLLKARRNAALLVTWALLPPVFYGLAYTIVNMFLPRYLVFTLPAWCLLAAYALEWGWLKRPARSGAVWAGVLFTMLSLWLKGQNREPGHRGEADYKRAAYEMHDHAQPGDAITFEGPYDGYIHLRIGFRYWLRRKPTFPREIFSSRSPEQVGNFLPELCNDSARCLPADVNRLWLVTMAGEDDLFREVPEERARLLKQEFEVQQVWPKYRVNLVLLRRRGATPTADAKGPGSGAPSL